MVLKSLDIRLLKYHAKSYFYALESSDYRIKNQYNFASELGTKLG